MVRKSEAGGSTVEVAHEALFREWRRLKEWLEPERARLDALRLIQTDAATWQRNDRDESFLNLRGSRLRAANALSGMESYRTRLSAAELDYLTACRKADWSLVVRSWRLRALAGLSFIALVGGLSAWWYQQDIKEGIYYLTRVRPQLLAAEREAALQPRDQFKECTACPEMVVVPPGSFTMGGPPDT